jgi:hypothetical protein
MCQAAVSQLIIGRQDDVHPLHTRPMLILYSRITRAFLIEEATIVKRVLKAKTTGKK